jgi:hypothetical protein
MELLVKFAAQKIRAVKEAFRAEKLFHPIKMQI